MKYKKPEMEVIKLAIEDVILTSPGLNDIDSNFNNDGGLKDDGEEWN